MAGSESKRAKGIGGPPGSLLWWLSQVAGLVVSLVLMLVLAAALSMLTRMVVEGRTDPPLHPPTVGVWWLLCTGALLVPMLRQTWQELASEQVHVDAAGNELRIDRWSPSEERERFAALVGAGDRGVAAPQTDADDRDADDRAAADELVVAQERARERPQRQAARETTAAVEPAVPSMGPDGQWSAPLRWLELAGMVCLVGWLPLLLVSAIVFAELQDSVASEWGLLPMALLPLGWVLLWVHHLLRHRWLRTRETRSDLAGLHGMTAFVLAVVLVLVALTGLIMRDEFLGVALISFPLAVLCGWVAQREMRHHVPDRTSSSDGSDTPVDITPLD